jgi:hypothetical protein
MNHPIKAYVSWVAAVGSVAIGAAFAECRFTHPVRFPVYFALAFLASMFKIRLPAISGTFTSSWLFVILAIAELDHTEAMIIAVGAAAGQTLLNVREKPTLFQLVFNIAALGISTSAAMVVKTLAGAFIGNATVVGMCAAATYYAVNVLVVSGVLSLVHAQTINRLWSAWLRWTTPAFLVSAAAAASLILIDPMFHFNTAILFVPAVVLFHIWYRRLLSARLGTAA